MTGSATISEEGSCQADRRYVEDPVATANSKAFDELYAYDGSYRLANLKRGTLNAGKTAVTGQTFGQCWTLDTTGNWKGFRQDDNGDGTWDLVQSRTANAVNEITGITNTTGSAWAAPAYNAAGNMTTMPQAIAPGSSFAATYDAWNRLVKLSEGANTVHESVYDGLRRRITKRRYSGGVLQATRHFYFSTAWQVLEERLGTSPDSATANIRYAWGLRYIDDLMLRDRDPTGDGTLEERRYALQDPNWNVVATTDQNGDVQERYAYDAYGVVSVLTPSFGPRAGGSSFGWSHFYACYAPDSESGLYVVRNRFYHPVAGVWVTRDRLGPLPPDYNLYCYGGSSPTQMTDAFGDISRKRFGTATEETNGRFEIHWSFEAGKKYEFPTAVVQLLKNTAPTGVDRNNKPVDKRNKFDHLQDTSVEYFELIGFIPANETKLDRLGAASVVKDIRRKCVSKGEFTPTNFPLPPQGRKAGALSVPFQDTWGHPGYNDVDLRSSGTNTFSGEVRLIKVDADFIKQVEKWNKIDRLDPPINTRTLAGRERSHAEDFENGVWTKALEVEAPAGV